MRRSATSATSGAGAGVKPVVPGGGPRAAIKCDRRVAQNATQERDMQRCNPGPLNYR